MVCTLLLAVMMWPLSPAVAQVYEGVCKAKCQSDYEDVALVCARMTNESEKRKCQNEAHDRYVSCRRDCQQAADCLEHCKEKCDAENERCIKNCPRGDRDCMNECNQQNGRCLKECDRRCK
jgi:hypothetical protein